MFLADFLTHFVAQLWADFLADFLADVLSRISGGFYWLYSGGMCLLQLAEFLSGDTRHPCQPF